MVAALAPDSERVAAFRADSGRAAELSKEVMDRIFGDMPKEDIDEITKITALVDEDPKDSSAIINAKNNSGRSATFRNRFEIKYKENKGRLEPKSTATKAWLYYRQKKGY